MNNTTPLQIKGLSYKFIFWFLVKYPYDIEFWGKIDNTEYTAIFLYIYLSKYLKENKIHNIHTTSKFIFYSMTIYRISTYILYFKFLFHTHISSCIITE
jgi:hypothetical protein